MTLGDLREDRSIDIDLLGKLACNPNCDIWIFGNLMNHKIHHLGVWVLVVIHFFIGLGWYALFGEAWLNYNARTMTDIEPPHGAVPYLIAIVAAIVVNYALAWLFAKLHVAHALTGLKIALICWFGFLFVQNATISVFSAF